ncbi:major capsid protein [Pseudomonas phage uligo]|uniref:Major capsid protein n=1 Tax=Pseudomonas phage uligo TaxID=2048979 RepID=A0A2H4P818_9CAUD|nr:major capsid protein [Pseudomonas phage uligo]ATW58190.1 major capsid protein [Pseudomonas phage uligo]
MSDVNNLVDPSISASGEAKTLAIEKFNGQIKRAYSTQVGMMAHFDLQTVVGTNTVSNKYLGTTEVQALAPGKDVKGSQTEVDKNSLVIDTVVIARNVVALLTDVQDDIMVKGKLAEEQVTSMKKLEDRMLIQQCIYGALINNKIARNNRPRVKGHGFSIGEVDKNFNMDDPTRILTFIESVIEQMVIQDLDISKLTIACPWPVFNSLRDAERIADARYNTYQQAGVTGFVLKSYNIPVVPNNHFPNKARDHINIDGGVDDHHLLSKVTNGFRYDVTDDQEACMFIIFGNEALLVGRSIALTGEIWWNKSNKTWYIDSYMSEGAIPDRWEHLAAGFGAEATSANLEDVTDRLTQRVKRKRMQVDSFVGVDSTGPGAQSRMASVQEQDPAAFAAAVAAAIQAMGLVPAASTTTTTAK